MGSILDVGKKKPRKYYRRSKKHYVNPLSSRRRFVRNKTQAIFALIIIIAIIVVAIIEHMWAAAGFISAIVFISVVLYFGPHLLGMLARKIVHGLKPHPRPITSRTEPKGRLNIPTSIKQQVYARARGRCERPRCSYSAKLHIHHIDKNPSNNSPSNLLAVCPNCHARIHDGEFSIDAQRSWITV
jgi:hypothetical protein